MLRENKNRFDLVISDVHMPDMDGFKLLELVGLEMDLPVIMMSVNGDSKLVMKGITHGACDYLLKPVRIEELKNIWQHVIRRKKFDSKDFNNTDNQGEHHPETAEGGEKLTGTGNADGNGKLNRKRKDQNEDEDDESEENGNESEDPVTQKKPRVVWSVELHRKFVAAVNQLGIDKAVPKRILDMMNVEKLTRENVASHLQKYRLYLKRISCVAGQPKTMVAALGIKDTSYLCMNSLEGLGDLHALTGSRQIPNTPLSSCQQGLMLSRLNASAGLGLYGSSSPGMIQQGHGLKSSDYVNDFGKRQQVITPVNQNVSLLQGMPTSLELEQFQHNKCISRIGGFSSPSNDLTVFPVASGFPESGVTIGESSNSFLNTTNSPLLLQGHPHQAKSRGGLGNQSSGRMASLNTDSLDVDASMSSQFPDHDRFNNNWQSAVTLSGFPLNPLCMGSTFNDDILPSSNLRENVYSRAPDNGISTLDCSSISSVTSVSTSFLNSRRDVRCQAGPIDNGLHHENSKFSNTMCNNVGQIYAPKQRWDGNQDYHHNRNLIFGSSNLSTSIHGVMGSLGHILDQGNATCSKKMDASLISQSNCGASVPVQHNEVEKSALYTAMKLKEAHMDKTKLQASYISNGNGSLEDIMSEIIKREQDEMTSVNRDFGIGIYSPGTYM